MLFFWGRTTKKENNTPTTVTKSTSFNWLSYEKKLLQKIDNADTLRQLIHQAEQNSEDTLLHQQIIKQSLLQHQPLIMAFHQFELAKLKNTATAYEMAGYSMLNAYKNNSDTLISNNIITFALQSFEKVLEFQPNNLDATVKIAEIYVEQGKEPMKGIQLLLGVVDSLPEYTPALIALGRFSLQSGQYDKAKERLENVLRLEPQNTEAIYFLAFAEAESGNKSKAIQLFELCKQLVNNPEFDKEINNFIEELKK